MTIYKSKSSWFVKIAAIGAVILVLLVLLSLFIIDNNYGVIGGIILGAIIMGVVIHFYAKALDMIFIEEDGIVLMKNIGQIQIPKSDILEVYKLEYSNLTMTYGSKGVFGFIGNTMDDSVSLVKDRKDMLKITTKDKKYILSSERCDELVDSIKTLYNIL